MDEPWFKLNPNNFKDPWWLYSSIRDTKTASNYKIYDDIVCYFIIQDANKSGSFYRFSIWYKNDPNRYMCVKKLDEYNFNKSLAEMKEGDIVYELNSKFRVYDCLFCQDFQKNFCKILERIENQEADIYFV